MAGVKFKNNAESTLDTAISAVDVGLSCAYGDGSLFPSLGASEYFYLTIESTDGTYEIVKVTARSGDSMTIVRAQEGTSAAAFAAGSRLELRITNQGLLDKFAEDNLAANSVALSKLATIATNLLLGRDTAGTGNVETLTVTQALDMIYSTQGGILYRNATEWVGLPPGTAGQILQSGGAAANPSWATGTLVSDGDKGDITVSASGATWTIDNSAVTLAKMANISQYYILGRSTAGSGAPEAIASSANMFSLLGAANYAAARSLLSLDTMALQAASAVAITGGTATGLSELQGTMKLSAHTSGTLDLTDANCVVPMTGNVTLNGGVFSNPQAFLFYAGSSTRTITQGTSMTLRLGGSATTGDRTLAAYTLAVGYVVGTNEIVITGSGVS